MPVVLADLACQVTARLNQTCIGVTDQIGEQAWNTVFHVLLYDLSGLVDQNKDTRLPNLSNFENLITGSNA